MLCGAPKAERPWRNKPNDLIVAQKSPRATLIRLESSKLQAFAVDNTAKPAFREALVSFICLAEVPPLFCQGRPGAGSSGATPSAEVQPQGEFGGKLPPVRTKQLN